MLKRKKPLKVAVIVNGNAGLGTSREGLGVAAARRVAKEDNIFVTHTKEELRAALIECIRRKIEVYAISGGDGTLQVTQSMLFALLKELAPGRPLPMVLILPLGTMRIIATNLRQTNTDVLSLAEYYGGKFRNGEPLETYPLPFIVVNGSLYCAIYGTGVITEILKAYNKKKRKGPIGALEVLQQSLFDEFFAALTFSQPKLALTKPVGATVYIPGHDPAVVPHKKHTTLVCSAVREVGLGCVGMPDAMRTPDTFMLRSSRMSYAEYILSGPAIWLGLKPMKTFDAVVRKVRIVYDEPTLTTVDGEMRELVTEDVLEVSEPVPIIIG